MTATNVTKIFSKRIVPLIKSNQDIFWYTTDVQLTLSTQVSFYGRVPRGFKFSNVNTMTTK